MGHVSLLPHAPASAIMKDPAKTAMSVESWETICELAGRGSRTKTRAGRRKRLLIFNLMCMFVLFLAVFLLGGQQTDKHEFATC